MDKPKVAIEPAERPDLALVVQNAGATPTRIGPEVEALVWTDYWKPEGLEHLLAENPQLKWVQLPFAGVDPFVHMFTDGVVFTSCKGSFREPVAEHALALALALGRAIPERVRATSWGGKFAASLYDAKVVIVGAGGITEELIKLLTPFRSHVTVIRNRSHQAFPGAKHTLGLEQLPDQVATADFVFVACALTSDTRGLFDRDLLRLFNPAAYLINIARGPIVVTDDLLLALNEGWLAGAGVDVTDPEPLPDGHPAWVNDKLIITPHTADTPDVVARLFGERLSANIAAYIGSGDWVGRVDPNLGY